LEKLKSFYKALQEFSFSQVEVGSRTTKGLFVRFSLSKKLQLCCRIKNPHFVECFAVGNIGESLTPEGQSSNLVFQVLSNQLEKVYAVYASMTDYPLGALLIHTYRLTKVMFEDCCQRCGQYFNKSVGDTILPPLFKDMWMRPESQSNQIYWHYMCLTCHNITKD